MPELPATSLKQGGRRRALRAPVGGDPDHTRGEVNAPDLARLERAATLIETTG